MRSYTHVLELLAPAGSSAAFWAALAGGADAIYCALGSDFNARRGADNFDVESFRAACRAAHLAGVRVYATMNIVIREDEMSQALRAAREVWLLGADALIVQDMGLFVELHKAWPEIEVHISTQTNVHNKRSVAWCRRRGARRITLSRELSLQEIRDICAQETAAHNGCELEVFVHGALCFSYSGLCMMSSMRALTQEVRSANRGTCAQPCRLPYDLIDENGLCIAEKDRTRPLCPRDACALPALDQLCEAGVGALKIEGRMKAPDYVYSVVSVYREALDCLAQGHTLDVTSLEKRLKHAFNRDFTDAYLRGTSGDEMMSYARSNNRGLLVGSVVASHTLAPQQSQSSGRQGGRPRKKQRRPADTDIMLHEAVHKGDLLEIRPQSQPELFLTASAPCDGQPHETIRVRTVRAMPEGCDVRLIRTQAALNAAARVVGKAEAGGTLRPRGVRARIVCRQGEPLLIELSCDGVRVQAEGAIVEAARTKALTAEQLVEHVGRMGATAFVLEGADLELDEGCGMSMAELHATRSEACRKLETALLMPWTERTLPAYVEAGPSSEKAVYVEPANVKAEPSSEKAGPSSEAFQSSDNACTPNSSDNACTSSICVRVTTPAAAHIAREAGATRIYAEVDALASYDGWPENIVPILPEVCREADFERVASWIQPGTGCVVSNLAELAYAQERGVNTEVLDGIPVHNTVCIQALQRSGVQRIWCSQELSLKQIERLASKLVAINSTGTTHHPVVLAACVYTRQRLMTSEHCVLQAANSCIHNCAACTLRAQRLFLRDERGRCMPVTTDVHGRSRVWMSELIDTMPEVPYLLQAGIHDFMIDATLLSNRQLQHEVERLAAALEGSKHQGKRQGKHPPVRERGATSGHMYLELV